MARGRAINFRPKAVLWAVLIQSESEWFRRFILRNENFVGKNEKKFYAQNRRENNISKVFGLKKKKVIRHIPPVRESPSCRVEGSVLQGRGTIRITLQEKNHHIARWRDRQNMRHYDRD